MIRLFIMTANGIEKRDFYAADQAQGHLDSRTDVIAFRAWEISAKQKERKKR